MARSLSDSPSIENLLCLDLPSGSKDELEDEDTDQICVYDNINCFDIEDNNFLDINWETYALYNALHKFQIFFLKDGVFFILI